MTGEIKIKFNSGGVFDKLNPWNYCNQYLTFFEARLTKIMPKGGC